MTFIGSPQWDYDIFLSYARADDRGAKWVSAFRERLMAEIGQYITDDIAAFFDESSGENPTKQTFTEKAKRSAILVAVTSRRYLTRPDCKNEYTAFGQTHADKQSVFQVQITSLDDDVAQYEGMEAVYPSIFFSKDGDIEAPHSLGDEKFQDALTQLRSRIVNKLHELKGKARKGELPALPTRATDSRPMPVVMVAESEKSLKEQEANVKSQLRQAGFTVIPKGDYPSDPQAFDEAFNSDLGRCHVFVQLLGSTRGRILRGMPEGVVRHQSDAADAFAKQYPGKIKVLRWHYPELDLDEIKNWDPEYHDFVRDVGKQLMAIEAFKTAIAEEARAALEPTPDQRLERKEFVGNELFLCVDSLDRPAAIQLMPQFDDYFMPIQYNVPQDTVADYDAHLKERFRRAAAVAVLQGEAPVTWIQSSLGLFYAAFGEEKLTRALPRAVVCQGPPPPKDPELPGRYRHVGRVDCTAGWDAKMIVAELLQPPKDEAQGEMGSDDPQPNR